MAKFQPSSDPAQYSLNKDPCPSLPLNDRANLRALISRIEEQMSALNQAAAKGELGGGSGSSDITDFTKTTHSFVESYSSPATGTVGETDTTLSTMLTTDTFVKSFSFNSTTCQATIVTDTVVTGATGTVVTGLSGTTTFLTGLGSPTTGSAMTGATIDTTGGNFTAH